MDVTDTDAQVQEMRRLRDLCAAMDECLAD